MAVIKCALLAPEFSEENGVYHGAVLHGVSLMRTQSCKKVHQWRRVVDSTGTWLAGESESSFMELSQGGRGTRGKASVRSCT